ncbi:MAG: hypothetical protein ACREQ5_11590 [Candidatus Dormibacteria bacterium]
MDLVGEPMRTLKVKKIEVINEPTIVYDIGMPGRDGKCRHSYILENGLVSHNSYVPTQSMSGGGGLKYAASIITFLSKSKKKDTTTNQVTGAIIRVKIDKSRFTREQKAVLTHLDHSKGLDKYYGLLDIAEAGGVVEKVANKYKLPNGTAAFESVIYKQPEKYFTKELLDQIDVAAGKIFKYGAGEDIQVVGNDAE